MSDLSISIFGYPAVVDVRFRDDGTVCGVVAVRATERCRAIIAAVNRGLEAGKSLDDQRSSVTMLFDLIGALSVAQDAEQDARKKKVS